MANKGIGVGICKDHGEYYLDSPDSPCPTCDDVEHGPDFFTTKSEEKVPSLPSLNELFNFEYVGTGYFRERGVKKGDKAKIIHGQEAIDLIYANMKNMLDK